MGSRRLRWKVQPVWINLFEKTFRHFPFEIPKGCHVFAIYRTRIKKTRLSDSSINLGLQRPGFERLRAGVETLAHNSCQYHKPGCVTSPNIVEASAGKKIYDIQIAFTRVWKEIKKIP